MLVRQVSRIRQGDQPGEGRIFAEVLELKFRVRECCPPHALAVGGQIPELADDDDVFFPATRAPLAARRQLQQRKIARLAATRASDRGHPQVGDRERGGEMFEEEEGEQD